MSKNKKIISSQEMGLRLAFIFGSYLYNIEHLHFGYWRDGMKLCLENLSKAQLQYCELLKSLIPSNVKTILDVGCGTGGLAKYLLNAGYTVDCVTPGGFFSSLIETNTEGKSEIFQTRFEELQTDKKYDLILFSESFQYIDIEKCLTNSINLLSDKGFILISDYFKRDKKKIEGKSPLSGGHKIVKFHEAVDDLPLNEIMRLDITDQTAPNLDLVNDLLENLAIPSAYYLNRYAKSSYLYKLVYYITNFFFRTKIHNIKRKYLSKERNAENFKKYKQYLVLLYQA